MKRKKIFVTGISTEVGKTIASAILVEALEADYWKPIQSGDLDYSDTDKVKALITNSKSEFFKNSYALNTPMSPHASAAIDGVTIDLSEIIEPETTNHLVIEGAGGLLVPLNETDTIADMIDQDYEVVVVSRHYLGSINHSLLTLKYLKERGFDPLIIFSGEPHPTTEEAILKMSKCRMLGRIAEEREFTPSIISKYADEFRPALMNLLELA
ncbi:dethiobiotin synthase [Robertkochia aurantiaca]|uniref:dethiobiotin synthase n=1 Tax=Robertkochia aurantiaca TaxID=2873700 RepID=UPI001CCBFA7C|nr:dethiobiotin synthase [Robertkochia sp. 3YJGBD-33]